jgi:hypothetical protein
MTFILQSASFGSTGALLGPDLGITSYNIDDTFEDFKLFDFPIEDSLDDESNFVDFTDMYSQPEQSSPQTCQSTAPSTNCSPQSVSVTSTPSTPSAAILPSFLETYSPRYRQPVSASGMYFKFEDIGSEEDSVESETFSLQPSNVSVASVASVTSPSISPASFCGQQPIANSTPLVLKQETPDTYMAPTSGQTPMEISYGAPAPLTQRSAYPAGATYPSSSDKPIVANSTQQRYQFNSFTPSPLQSQPQPLQSQHSTPYQCSSLESKTSQYCPSLHNISSYQTTEPLTQLNNSAKVHRKPALALPSPTSSESSVRMHTPTTPTSNSSRSSPNESPSPSQLCAVCGDNAACQHYGVRTCEGTYLSATSFPLSLTPINRSTECLVE